MPANRTEADQKSTSTKMCKHATASLYFSQPRPAHSPRQCCGDSGGDGQTIRAVEDLPFKKEATIQPFRTSLVVSRHSNSCMSLRVFVTSRFASPPSASSPGRTLLLLRCDTPQHRSERCPRSSPHAASIAALAAARTTWSARRACAVRATSLAPLAPSTRIPTLHPRPSSGHMARQATP
jgi:hypothetical protein